MRYEDLIFKYGSYDKATQMGGLMLYREFVCESCYLPA